MRNTFFSFFLLAFSCLLTQGCKDSNINSSVPTSAVHLQIDTRSGIFVHFSQSNISSYIIVNQNGYHFNNTSMPLRANEYYGYAGVVIYVSASSSLRAFDLCCPHCLNKNTPLSIDGIYAVCPICKEKFDLINGFGMPTQGICKENLKTYNVSFTNSIITVRN